MERPTPGGPKKRRSSGPWLLILLGIGLTGCPGHPDQIWRPPPCEGDWTQCQGIVSLVMMGERVFPEEGPEPAQGAERVRVTITCGDESVVVEGDLVPQPDGSTLIDLPDLAVPADAGVCAVEACIIGTDGDCVDYCAEAEGEVEIRGGEAPPVDLDFLCVDPFPGGVNVRVGVRHVRPSRPVYLPSKDIHACGGFTELQFGFETPPPPGVEYSIELRVSDPLYADRVRILPLPGDRFRIIGLAHGLESDVQSEDGFVPLRATLIVEGVRASYDTHIYVRGNRECRCRGARPGAGVVEARGADGAAECRVDGRRVQLVSAPLGVDEWASCRATLGAMLDISGLFGDAADTSRLRVGLCNESAAEEWVTLLFYTALQPRRDMPHERVSLQLGVGPAQCAVHVVSQADFELDPQSSGQFDPSEISRVEMIRAGAAGAATMSMQLDMECCGAVGVLCCIPGAVESCNGLDDDCDGAIDEEFGVGDACEAGVGGCRRMGRLRCDDALEVCSAEPGRPVPEVCNDTDDDCDGTVDEGFGRGELCTSGVGACARGGVTVCALDEARVMCSADPGEPQAEVCNAIDDDCDGRSDEGLGGGACAEADGACGPAGTWRCRGGALVCEARAPAQEACGGADDDCDGRVDEGLGRREIEFFQSGGGCCDSHDNEKISDGERAEGPAFDVAQGQRVRVEITYAVDGHVGCVDCPDNWRCDDPMAQGDERLRVELVNAATGGVSILGMTDDVNGSGGDWDDRPQRCTRGSNDFQADPNPGRYFIRVVGEGGSVILKNSRATVHCR